jgi:hypothetical protein
MDTLLDSIYFNPENPSSFGGISKLFKSSKVINKDITIKDVRDYLSRRNAYTLHKPARRHFTRNRIYVSQVDEMWEMDLVDMQMFSRQNKSYKYILVIIDAFSKYVWAEPLKTKSPIEVINVFKKIFKYRKPEKIRSDRGLEFNNKPFKNFCDSNGITYFTTQNKDIKCALVERVNRTLKEKIFRIFTHFGTRKWIDYLPQVVMSYNKSKHRSTRMAPIDVDISDEKQVFRNLYGAENFKELFFKNKSPKKFKVGDFVRMKYDLTPMDKSYYPLWTETIYKIIKVLNTVNKAQYVLELDGEELKRRFYPEELQKVSVDENTLYRIERILGYRTVNGQRQAKIRWLGYTPNYDTWIPVDQIERL